MRSHLPFLPALFLAASCGGSVSAPPHAAITIDAPACEHGLETIATIDSPTPSSVRLAGLAVGADGTVYFSRWGAGADPGIYAIAPGGTPRRISPLVDVAKLFVERDTLVVAGRSGTLYSLPTGGGDPTTLSKLPIPIGHEPPLTDTWALDATWAYTFALDYGDKPHKLWRLPRAGGSPELLFESADKQYQANWMSSLMVDGDALDFTTWDGDAKVGGLMQVPKTGGTPALLLPDARPLGTPDGTVRVGDTFYATFSTYGLTAFLRDGSTPRPIEGDGGSAAVVRTIGDAQSAYAAILTASPDAQRTAFVRLPSGDEHTTATGCTATASGDMAISLEAMALGPTHVYALGWTNLAKQRWTIVRAPR